MPDFIKLNSDRPDYEQTLRTPDGQRVDLTDASSVYLLMWNEDNELVVNHTATIDTPALGVVTYDFDRGEVVSPGTNEIEIRVEWSDGDRQWFPVDERGYELEVVQSAGDRDASLTEVDAETDAEVNRLLIHDAIDVQDDDGEMEIVNGDVAIPGGDLTVGGTVTIGDLVFGDDDPLTFGTDLDFTEQYDSTSDVWALRNNVANLDVLTVTKGGNVTAPTGWLSAETLDVTRAGNEQNLRFGSKDSGVTTHAYLRALIEHDGVSGDAVLAFGNSDTGTGVARVDLATGDAEYDGSVTIAGDIAATRAWAQADNIAHADLADAPSAAHHGDLTIQDSGAEIAAGDYTLNFGDSLDVTESAGTVRIDNPITSQYTDEQAQDAVAAALDSSHFTYDDANDLIEFNAGNVAHDDHSGIDGTNHHDELTVADSGSAVAAGDYALDFTAGLGVTASGGTVSIENTGVYTDEDAQDAVGDNVGDGLTYDDANAEVGMNVVASGSATLSSGSATIDTGVSSSTTATFMVAFGPDTDDADVAADIRAASGANYEVDIHETDTDVTNPTVEYDIVRVR